MQRHREVAVELGLFVGLLGLPDGGLGVMWPSLRRTFHRPVGDLGILVLAGMVPYLGSSALAARVVRRTGFGTFTVLVGAVAVLSFLSWATAPVWAVAVGAFAALGWSRGGTDAALNAHASLTEGVRRLGLLHAVYGAGATAGPLLVSVVLVLGGGWRTVVAILAVLAAAVTVAAVAARGGWARPGDLPSEAASGLAAIAPTVPAKGQDTGGRGGVAATLGAFAVYTAAEAATGAWAFTVMTEGRHLDRGYAAGAVAAYWGALTGGRVLVAAVGHRFGRGLIVWGGAGLALIGVVVFAVGGPLAGAAGLPLAGLGFGPLFPVMVSLIPDRVEASRSTTVIGWAVGVAAIGGPAGTALVGVLAGQVGLATVGGVLVVLAATLLAAEVMMFEGVT